MSKKLMAILLLIFTNGCAVKPSNHHFQVPTSWSSKPSEEITTKSAQLESWWKHFNDPTLNRLVQEAIKANKNLQIAQSRIREAKALLGVSKSALMPSAGSSFSVNRLRGGFAQGLTGVGGNSLSSNSSSSLISPFETNIFQVGFDASWEMDLFGRNRQAVSEANAEVVVAQEEYRDLLVSLLGEVAHAYISICGLHRRIEVLEKNIVAQNETRYLTDVRVRAGLASELDLSRASAQLARTESELPMLQLALAKNIHRIGILLGKEPTAVEIDLEQARPVPVTPPEIPIGLPSDLLRRRPDIRRAEAVVAVATARLGIAEKELLPKFSLTGLIGRQGTELSGLTLGAGSFFSIGPSVRLPIFTAGRIKSNIKVQEARQEQTLIGYEQTVLRSLEDVENALTAYSKERVRKESLVKAVKESQRAVELANELYTKGLSDFLSVLEAERQMYENEDLLASSEAEVAIKLVALYKALGGGW